VTDRDGMYVHVTAKGAMVRQLGLADSRLYKSAAPFGGFAIIMPKCCGFEDLARVGNVSATSFFLHFRAVTSLATWPR
jgi:hypothetical protein